jgi:predicted short-subunit dehydrogenase-like oxidoreductase (DUF2520 family)
LLTRKSNIVFIGAGRVAHTLVPHLIKKKYSVRGIISKSTGSARSLAKKYNIDHFSNNYSYMPAGTGIFFITVPDDEIVNAASKLASLRLNFGKLLFIHTSGTENSNALKMLREKGSLTASFHILQTFPSTKQAEIKNCVAAIETNSSIAERFLFYMAKALELQPIKLTEEGKIFYHLAAVFAANFLNSNLYSAEKLLTGSGIKGKKLYHLFEPIVNTTLSNIKNTGVDESISGPVLRGDFHTIQKHIDLLNKLSAGKKNLFLQSYILQSLILLEIIKRRGKRLTRKQNMLKKVLEAELKRNQD